MKSELENLVAGRRQLLKLAGAAATAGLFVGCGGASVKTTTSDTSTDTSSDTGSSDTSGDTTTTENGSCVLIPEETQGPYPLLAILSNSAMVRQDITEGKTGVPLTISLKIIDINNSCTPISNAAVYIWHCDKDGHYSGYSSNHNGGNYSGQTFMRGIQVTDSDGIVTFTAVYPGWYAGRITHVHFQIYLNDNLTVTATATSQLAFPADVTTAVYNSSLYTKGQNTSVTSFSQDNIFSDGTTYQMVSIEGDTTNGYVASLTVGIAGT